MALSRARYRRTPELYVCGKELVLKDGNIFWVQVLNQFEMEEARSDGQVARARLAMALKEHGSDELAKVMATIFVDGIPAVIDLLVEGKSFEFRLAATEAVANDPEWKERLEIADRQDEIISRPASDPERKLLDQINADWLALTQEMVELDQADLRARLEGLSEDALVEEYKQYYIDRRGAALGMAEYSLIEIWYATRCCDGVKSDEGEWDHSACEGHELQAYESKAEVRKLPEELQDLLGGAVRDLEMTVREAKNLARQGSSSEPSPLPSKAEESIPSGPVETLEMPPGTSL